MEINYTFIIVANIAVILVFVFFSVKSRKKRKVTRKRKKEYVYIIARKGFAFRKKYKIGKAKDYEKRLKQLQTGSPNEYKIIAYFETSKPFELENAAHKKYKSKKKRGEWYSFFFFEIPFVIKSIKKLNKKL